MTIEKKLRRSAPVLGGFMLALHAPGCDRAPATMEARDAGADAGYPPVDADGTVANPPLVLADALASPRGVALDETSAYVLVHPHLPEGAGQLLQIDRDSGRVSVLASMRRPGDLVGDARFLYWTEAGGAVRRFGKHDGTLVTLADGQDRPTHLAVGPAGVFWATSSNDVVRADLADGASRAGLRMHFDGAVTGIVVNGADVVVSLASGELWQVAVASGARRPLLRGQDLAGGFVADKEHYYWIDGEQGALVRAHKDLLQVEHVAYATSGPAELVLTDDAIVWSELDEGRIQRIARQGGGEAETLASELSAPTSIAASGAWIVWIDDAEGSVLALRPRP